MVAPSYTAAAPVCWTWAPWGGAASAAYGINNAGQVVGYADNGDGYHRAFLKNPGQPMIDLDDLGGGWGMAQGINNLGQVVGQAEDGDGKTQAFLKETNPDQPMVPLGFLEGGSYSIAYGINDAGQVVGQADKSGGHARAFLINPGQTMVDLATLGGGGSGANGINNLGEVVGWAQITASILYHAFLKTPGQAMEDLGTLPGGYYSEARGINNEGQVVGWADNAEGKQAVLKNPGQDLEILNTQGGGESEAYSINAFGQVVGMVRDAYGNIKGCLWENGDMHDLSSLTDNIPLGIFLNEAIAINDQGWIAGRASNDYAFLLTPAPPAAGYVPLGLLLH